MEEAKGFTAGHMMVEAAMDMLDKHLMPDLGTFLSFLDYQKTILSLSRHTLAAPERPVRYKQQTPKKAAPKLQESYNSKGTHKISCILCNADHFLFACTDFKALSVQERWTKIKQQARFNCLSKGHGSNSCPSKVRCRRCHKLHHTMLHNEAYNAECLSPAPSVTATASAERSTATASADRPSASASSDTCSVALACPPASRSKVPMIPVTALAVAFSGSHECRCRIQMDAGAMLSLVTTKLARSLDASKIRNTAVTISGVGGEIFSPYQVKITLKSLQRNESIVVRANVADSIPECLAAGQFPAIGTCLNLRVWI